MSYRPSDLVSLDHARKHIIPRRPDGKPVNPSTVWRWARKGLSGANGERIWLNLTYAGNRPYTSQEAIDAFFQAVTDAKLKRHRYAEERAVDVTQDQLETAGLR